jgi:EAL domain-containing protein (putative c-di-GMP-specific phosphodiesterase class I)
VRHLTLSGALREAIEGNQLYFDYQPKLDLIAGTIASVEALARWRHPTQGLIPPGEFVAQAEQTGLIQPLTHWTFNSAFAQLAAWRRDGLAISVSINLSSRSLHDDKLPRTVADLLEEWQVDPAGITLELTESAVMLDPAGAQRNLFRLYDLGLRLSIDDFGTGYSSLSHLQRLPLDELKIDRSFVAQMDTNQQDLVIVRSTIDLAHNLGLRVVAEGIESARHIALLRRLGCQLGQGFFIAEPLSIELLTRWLGEPRRAPGAAEETTAATLAEETL